MSKLTAAIIEDEVPAARLLSSIITRLRPDWGGYRTTRKCGRSHCLVQDTFSSGYSVSGYSVIGR